MTAASSDYVYRHARVEQRRFVAASQVMKADTRE